MELKKANYYENKSIVKILPNGHPNFPQNNVSPVTPLDCFTSNDNCVHLWSYNSFYFIHLDTFQIKALILWERNTHLPKACNCRLGCQSPQMTWRYQLYVPFLL